MKKTAVLTLLLFTLFTAAAQKKRIDTLRLALSKAKTDSMRFKTLYKLTQAYYFLPNPDSTVIFGQQAWLLAKNNNWVRYQERCIGSLANVYGDIGDYVKAISFYFKALKIEEELKELDEIANLNDNIAATYIQRGDYKKALPYSQIALKDINTFYLTHKSAYVKDFRVAMYVNIGLCYLRKSQPDSAEYVLNLAHDDVKKFNLTDNSGTIRYELGEVEAERGNKTRALQFFRQAIIINKTIGGGNFNIYLSTANLYHKYKQQDSAEYYARKALEDASAGKFEQGVLDAGKVLYAIYDEENNLPQAYKYFKIVTAAKDSIYSQDKIKQLLSIDFNEKERQQELETAQREAQKEAENRLRTYILSGGLAVLLLLAIIFWRNSNQRKKANHLLSKQKYEIEQQRDQTNKALTDLKLTQNQLIQSEKMASLGELTAGIAHEIQNPLNFVNNFSEVSVELLEELKEEAKAGNNEDVIAIASDLTQNLEKIKHHGKRADFIVKGMLQHSRASTGERQPTNMNTLAEEFFKLSYQGLRAKDKAFNSEMVIHIDPDLPKVNIVQQDMGRVLLNLFNNAFYAVNQKAKTAGDDYKPEVILTTLRENGRLLIKVKDNGVGIPDAIKEKILQPFFTTKPTGEGTGLGLSLSYDILVKGHNGILDINSTEGEGSEFIVKLPLN